MVNVLFVCMGNICRSPTAEGVFRKLVDDEGLSQTIIIDSAGTLDYHRGSPPDLRAQAVARRRDVDLSQLRARQVEPTDFRHFDYVIAMDWDNHAYLTDICPGGAEDRLKLFMDFAPNEDHREVPDPYYGGEDGFELMLDLIETASEGLLAQIRTSDL